MISLLLIATSIAIACAPPQATVTPPAAAEQQSSPLLAELAREDQASRTGQTIARTDAERVRLVLAEVAGGRVPTPQDKFNAALVLQHTGMTFCNNKLVSLSPDNYLLAHHLATAAFEGGHAQARYLVAQTIDRYLSTTEGYQRYGTNRFINQETGAEELSPIDRSVSDAERARYGVPTLAELLAGYPEQKRPVVP